MTLIEIYKKKKKEQKRPFTVKSYILFNITIDLFNMNILSIIMWQKSNLPKIFLENLISRDTFWSDFLRRRA